MPRRNHRARPRRAFRPADTGAAPALTYDEMAAQLVAEGKVSPNVLDEGARPRPTSPRGEER